MPSILIDDSAIHLLNAEVRKYCFPYEVVFDEHKANYKRRTIHRHYYNYSTYFSDDELNDSFYIDNFSQENFKVENVFKQRTVFERMISRDEDKTGFVNFLLSDESYSLAVSDFNPDIQTLISLVYDSFGDLDYEKCLNLVKDLQSIFDLAPVKSDPLMHRQLANLRKLVEEKIQNNNEDSNYTTKLY